jgi:hypothetical protein
VTSVSVRDNLQLIVVVEVQPDDVATSQAILR